MWLTEDEFEDLLRRMREIPTRSRGVDPEEKYRRDRAIVYLFTYAGLRVEEVSHLKLTDLDSDMKRCLENDQIDKIVLYGSRARGDYKRTSR